MPSSAPCRRRPLVLGRREGRRGEEWCVASEDCAFGPIGFERVRDVQPGEMVIITPEGNLVSRQCAVVGAVAAALLSCMRSSRCGCVGGWVAGWVGGWGPMQGPIRSALPLNQAWPRVKKASCARRQSVAAATATAPRRAAPCFARCAAPRCAAERGDHALHLRVHLPRPPRLCAQRHPGLQLPAGAGHAAGQEDPVSPAGAVCVLGVDCRSCTFSWLTQQVALWVAGPGRGGELRGCAGWCGVW